MGYSGSVRVSSWVIWFWFTSASVEANAGSAHRLHCHIRMHRTLCHKQSKFLVDCALSLGALRSTAPQHLRSLQHSPALASELPIPALGRAFSTS